MVRAIALLLLVAIFAGSGEAQSQPVTCKRTFKKVGCLKTTTIMKDLLINDRDTSSDKYQGILLDWKKFGESIHSLACRCAEKAVAGGYPMFAIRYFAECYGTKKEINMATATISNDCIGPSFKECIHSQSEECVGKASSEYFYQTVASIPTEQPSVNGGYSDWTDWGKCTVTCGDTGEQSRERVCNNPPPSGPLGKDCSGTGPSTELRSCNRVACPDKCPDMLGDYGDASISLADGNPFGKWTGVNRPDFKGVFTGDCRGEITFPDDRKFNFEYDKTNCRIIWDGDRNHVWSKRSCFSACQCTEILGDYTFAVLTMTNGNPLGRWIDRKRPDFGGVFTGVCKGEITFPDDRKYTFEYDKANCQIVWDSNRNHVWKKKSCNTGGLCPAMSGDYVGATLSMIDGQPLGRWTSGPRPEFRGSFSGDCKGAIIFPDDRRYTFEYDKANCQIIWDGDKNHVWRKRTCTAGGQCPAMFGDYYDAVISMTYGSPLGKWTTVKRPDFPGVFTGECKGAMTFPDDRRYTFEYDNNNCLMIWDGDKNHFWKKKTCDAGCQCSEILGDYNDAVLSMTDGRPLGKWISVSRPDFDGVFTGGCKGEMTFPDDRKYAFDYDKANCRIIWDGDVNHIWKKKTCP